MKFPDKLFEYRETVIYDCTIVLENIKGNISIMDLYQECRKKFNGIQEFFDALDVLYALNKISYDYKTRRISYVKGDNL